MKFTNRKRVTGLALLATVALSACGGSSGDSESAGSGVITSNDFSFPEVAAAQPGDSIAIPEGQLPEFSARRTVISGQGSAIEFGDPVVISYNMYSWTTGELVETTDAFDEPITVRAGVSSGVPEYLTKSLLGRQIGDTLQLVFAAGTEDLPSYIDSEDAYVLMVNLL